MTFEVSLRPIQFGAADGDRFEVFPVIENPTDGEASDTVELLVDGVVRDSRTVTLSADESETVKLVWDVSVSSNQTLPVTVSTGSDSAADEVTLRVFDDVIRIRFDQGRQEKFVEGTDDIGAGT